MPPIKYYFLLVLLLFISCDKSKKVTDKSHWNVEDEVDFMNPSTFLSEIKIISLETKNYLVGNPEKIIKDDSIYFVMDNRYNKCIYLFNTKGEEAGVFKNFGQGNNEYLDIKDFDLDNEQIVLLCFPSKLFFVDKKNLEIKNIISLSPKRYYDRLTINGQKILIYDHYNSVVENVNLLTGKTEIIHNTRPMKGYTMPSQSVFHRCSENLLFQSPGNDTIYSIKNNQFIPFLVFDYKEKKLAANLYANRDPSTITRSEIASNPVPNIETIFKQGDSYGFIYTFRGLMRINTIKNNIREEHRLKYLPFNTCNSRDSKHIITWDNIYRSEINETDASKYLKDIKINKDLYYNNETDNNPVLIEYIIK